MKKTVLIVDDNKDLLDVYRELLQGSNFNVICFSSAKQAKDYLATSPSIQQIKAIVSDLMMAPPDGLDFLSFVKSQPQLNHIDFFLLTGASVSVFEPFIRNSKLKGVLSKPFDIDKFLKALSVDTQQTSFQNKIAS